MAATGWYHNRCTSLRTRLGWGTWNRLASGQLDWLDRVPQLAERLAEGVDASVARALLTGHIRAWARNNVQRRGPIEQRNWLARQRPVIDNKVGRLWYWFRQELHELELERYQVI